MKTSTFLCCLAAVLITAACPVAFGAVAAKSKTAPSDPTDLVAHEWGTFTTVQGSDGKPLWWNGVQGTVLPSFVHDWGKLPPAARGKIISEVFDKSNFFSLARMETPVIYLYSKNEIKADVTVKFPMGRITEWYPRADLIGPPPSSVNGNGTNQWLAFLSPHHAITYSTPNFPPQTNSMIRWMNINVLPDNQFNRNGVHPPNESSGNHYFAARETDAAFLGTAASTSPHRGEGRGEVIEHEKFLFYRGVGWFSTPLQVTANQPPQTRNQNELVLTNNGGAPLLDLFVLEVCDGRAAVQHLDRLPSGQVRSVSLQLNAETDGKPIASVLAELECQMRDALIAQKLFPREAQAMVKTWRSSWFEEQGVRVLFLLPNTWTDQTLPLEIKPAPRETVRVMVGRSEIITPRMETHLRDLISTYYQPDAKSRERALAGLAHANLGRFARPAVESIVQKLSDQAERDSAYKFIAAAFPPPDLRSH